MWFFETYFEIYYLPLSVKKSVVPILSSASYGEYAAYNMYMDISIAYAV